MIANLPALVTEQMLRRICGEYLEMPGLRLTLKQAQRLWDLDEETCTQAMHILVEVKFLRRTGLEMYGRLTEGAVTFPIVPMVEVQSDQRPAA